MTDAELNELLASYVPGEAAVRTVRDAKIVLLVGITGAGKNTLKRELLKDDAYYEFISHTTRPPRSNLGVMEQDGKDYFFIDTNEAIRMLKAGEYIEAKKVHSNIYGTAIEGLKPSVESDRIAVNDIDVQGVDEYKTMSPDVHAVFLLPPSLEEWHNRRLARYGGRIDPEDNQVRLESAKMELEFALNKGYFDFLVNDDVTQAAQEIKHIVAGTKDSAAHDAGELLARALYDELSTH
jgi:guanylate kinase